MFYVYANGKLINQPLDKGLRLIAPKLTLERGKAGSLTFQIPPTNRYYNSLPQLSTTITVEMDDTEIFCGRVLSNNRGFNNIRSIYCEGILAYLVDTVQKGEKYVGSAHALFRRAIEAHNKRASEEKRFVIGEITVEDKEITLTGKSNETEDEDGNFDYDQIVINSVADEWKKTHEYIQANLVEPVGGYLRARRQNGVNVIDWLSDSSETAEADIEFGKNLLDLTEEISAEDVFTVLIPLGEKGLTIESVNGGSDELIDEEGVAKYGRIVLTHVFDGVTNPETLIENGRRYMQIHAGMPRTITAKAVDMHLINKDAKPIFVGKRVRVLSMPHDMYDELNCVKIEYDLENLANITYTFGLIKQGLTERYRKDRQETQRETERASRGGGGAGKAAEEETKKLLDKFYDAWINYDKDAAHVDLGTLYKEFVNAKTVLEQSCGIILDAPSGNINIRNMRKEFDENERKLLEAMAQIDIINDATKTQIEMIAGRTKTLEEGAEKHAAELRLLATDTQSAIEGKADLIDLKALELKLLAEKQKVDSMSNVLTNQVGIHLDGEGGNVNLGSLSKKVDALGEEVSRSVADIKTHADDLGAQIDLQAKLTTSQGEKLAAIAIKTDSNESAIEMKADKILLDAKVLELQNLIAKKLSAEEITSNLIESKISRLDRLRIDTSMNVYGPSYLVGGVSIGGSFSLNGNTVSQKDLTLVTDFTQASTPGWTASPVSKTLLATAISDVSTHRPAAGTSVRFN